MNKKQRTVHAEKDLVRYGRDIIISDIFVSGFDQTHHYYTTVADHTLNVALTSLEMAYRLEKLHIHLDKRPLVTGALCHDLGIIGRHNKYKNDAICCQLHPLDSVKAARTLLKDLDPKTRKIISRHMFPMTPLPPTSLTGWVVDIADTISTYHELSGHSKGPDADIHLAARKRIRTLIEQIRGVREPSPVS